MTTKEDCTLLIDKLANKLTDLYDQRLQVKLNLSYSEWKMLHAISVATVAPTQEIVAELTHKSPPAVSRQLDNLEKKNLIERKAHLDSKRTKLIALTNQGKRVYDKSKPLIDEVDELCAKYLNEDYQAFIECTLGLIDQLDNYYS